MGTLTRHRGSINCPDTLAMVAFSSRAEDMCPYEPACRTQYTPEKREPRVRGGRSGIFTAAPPHHPGVLHCVKERSPTVHLSLETCNEL